MNAYAQPTPTPFRQYKIHLSDKIAESLRCFTRDTGVTTLRFYSRPTSVELTSAPRAGEHYINPQLDPL